MDLLRNLFGNVTAGIIRLLVAVGILAAAYLFIVKPTLDTAKEVSHEVDANVQESLRGANLGDVGRTIEDVNRGVQRQIRHSLRASKRHGHANELIHCIQLAHQDVEKIQRCTEKH